MYSKILVPVSLAADRNTARAFEVAQLLAGDAGEIHAMHVIEVIPSFSEAYVPERLRLELEEQSKTEFENLVPDVAATSEIVHGAPGSMILKRAEDLGADCIVVASHRPEFSDYLLGSTAARVVRHANCAVHVIR